MTSKIHIKMGEIEIEYEGPEQFLKEDLSGLLADVSNLHTSSSAGPASTVLGNGAIKDGKLKGSVTQFATTLKCGGAAKDLAIAAAAHLTFVAGVEEFTRQQLLDGMKEATGFYKASMVSNFTKTISTCLKGGELVETRTGVYALTTPTRERLRASLVT